MSRTSPAGSRASTPGRRRLAARTAHAAATVTRPAASGSRSGVGGTGTLVVRMRLQPWKRAPTPRVTAEPTPGRGGGEQGGSRHAPTPGSPPPRRPRPEGRRRAEEAPARCRLPTMRLTGSSPRGRSHDRGGQQPSARHPGGRPEEQRRRVTGAGHVAPREHPLEGRPGSEHAEPAGTAGM